MEDWYRYFLYCGVWSGIQSFLEMWNLLFWTELLKAQCKPLWRNCHGYFAECSVATPALQSLTTLDPRPNSWGPSNPQRNWRGLLECAGLEQNTADLLVRGERDLENQVWYGSVFNRLCVYSVMNTPYPTTPEISEGAARNVLPACVMLPDSIVDQWVNKRYIKESRRLSMYFGQWLAETGEHSTPSSADSSFVASKTRSHKCREWPNSHVIQRLLFYSFSNYGSSRSVVQCKPAFTQCLALHIAKQGDW